MPSHSERATLLVFTLGPDRERARRRLLPRGMRDVELHLHRQGLETALAAGRSCGCLLAVSAPEHLDLPAGTSRLPQHGGTFGERLGHALAGVRRRDSSAPVVVVGSDVPELTSDHLRRTLELLDEDENRVVVGPSPDGGFYLLASRRPVTDQLRHVRWRRKDALVSLLESLARAGRPVALLPALADLDRRTDLERWLATPGDPASPWHGFRGLLRSVLAALRRPESVRRIGLPQRLSPAVLGARAPPG